MSDHIIGRNESATQAHPVARLWRSLRQRCRVLGAVLAQRGTWHEHTCPDCRTTWWCQSGLCADQPCSPCLDRAWLTLQLGGEACLTDETIAAHLDARLSLAEREAVVTHLAACDRCRQIARTVNALTAYQRAVLSAAVTHERRRS